MKGIPLLTKSTFGAQSCLCSCSFNNGRETSVFIRDLAPFSGKQNLKTDVRDSEARVENEPMMHVENDPKLKMITLLIKTQQINHVKTLVKLLMKTMLYCRTVQHVHGNQ